MGNHDNLYVITVHLCGTRGEESSKNVLVKISKTHKQFLKIFFKFMLISIKTDLTEVSTL